MKKAKKKTTQAGISRAGWLAVVIFAAAAAVYLNSLGGEFVYDDKDLVVENWLIRSPANIPRVLGLTGEKPPQRPVRHLSYMIDYQVSGLRPWGYHAFNIFYHALASLAVFFVALRLLGRERVFPAFAAALLFALHPIQTDSVAYVSGRRDILSGLFYLLGFFSFMKFREGKRLRWFLGAYALYLVGFFSKEMAITLPLVFLLYDWAREGGEQTPRELFGGLLGVLRRYWPQYFLFLTTSLLLAFYTVYVDEASGREGYYGGSLLLNFLTVARVVVYYVFLLLVPLRLSPDYTYNAFPATESAGDPVSWLAVVLVGSLAGAGVWGLTRSRWAGFAGLWFFLTLIPVSHIVPHHILMAEHFLYLPSFAFCLLAGLALERLAREKKLKIAAYAGLVILAFGYSVRTIIRNQDWKDPVDLWKKTVQLFPECAHAHSCLGLEYLRLQWYELAVGELERAIEIRPGKSFDRFNLGYAYSATGRTEEARREHLKAIEESETMLREHHGDSKVRTNLGILYGEMGRLDEAITELKRSVEDDYGNALAHYNLGYMYNQKGMAREAVGAYRKVILIDPDNTDARNNLGALYARAGMLEEAIREFEEVLKIRPGNPAAAYNLGHAYFQGGRCRRGIEMWESAVRRDPDRKRALYYSEKIAGEKTACP